MPTGIYERTKEYKQERSLAVLGRNNPFWGRHHSEKTKQKISKGKKGQTYWFKGFTWEQRFGTEKAEEIKEKLRQVFSREGSARWKGGRIVSSDGYILIKNRNHPNSDTQGYILEHRLVAEKALNRYLKLSEVCHHRDGKRDNNDWDNLFVFENRAEHFRYEQFLHRDN